MFSRVALVVSCVIVIGASANDLYTPTPFGHMLRECVHVVPEGSHFTRLDSGTHVQFPNGTSTVLRCNNSSNSTLVGMPLPPDYDGWLQYTAVNVSKLGLSAGFDAFTNVMSVPDIPKRKADILYLFPGLQNIDWIPKVDPEPTRAHPFDIIQPVLQYPGGGLFSSKWKLRSWYVTVNDGAMMSEGFDVEAGDAVFCNMTRTGDDSWSVEGTLKSSGKKTTQAASNARLALQPWAYNTLECYGCDGCDTYPTKPVTFTENKLYQAGKEITVPGSMWEINPKPAKKLECHEKTTVAANGDTTIAFN